MFEQLLGDKAGCGRVGLLSGMRWAFLRDRTPGCVIHVMVRLLFVIIGTTGVEMKCGCTASLQPLLTTMSITQHALFALVAWLSDQMGRFGSCFLGLAPVMVVELVMHNVRCLAVRQSSSDDDACVVCQ